MASSEWSCILFDFDGTIVDSAPGIIEAMSGMLAQLGLPEREYADLRGQIGPPLPEIVRQLTGFEGPALTEAIAVYRSYRSGGIYKAELFEGMAELLEQLHEEGMPLAVATSRPEADAQAALRHFRLSDRFAAECGSVEEIGRNTKALVVAEALRQLAEAGHDVSRPLLVGDRIHDAEGAAENSIDCLIVGWGYGSEAEAAGTLGYVHDIDALRARLLGRAAADEPAMADGLAGADGRAVTPDPVG